MVRSNTLKKAELISDKKTLFDTAPIFLTFSCGSTQDLKPAH
jgi:hypothetical protein